MTSSNFSGFSSSNWALLQSGQYSDLTVKCEAREWKVHRLVICPRSGFFENACKNDFEASDPP